MSEDAIARVRRLLAAATPGPWNDFSYMEDGKFYGGMQMRGRDWKLASELHRLAPALCDVIDAVCRARDAESGDESCRILREEVVLALDALDRAAEEASDDC